MPWDNDFLRWCGGLRPAGARCRPSRRSPTAGFPASAARTRGPDTRAAAQPAAAATSARMSAPARGVVRCRRAERRLARNRPGAEPAADRPVARSAAPLRPTRRQVCASKNASGSSISTSRPLRISRKRVAAVRVKKRSWLTNRQETSVLLELRPRGPPGLRCRDGWSARRAGRSSAAAASSSGTPAARARRGSARRSARGSGRRRSRPAPAGGSASFSVTPSADGDVVEDRRVERQVAHASGRSRPAGRTG